MIYKDLGNDYIEFIKVGDIYIYNISYKGKAAS